MDVDDTLLDAVNLSTTGWKYAKNVHAQINPNLTERIKWTDESKAIGKGNGYASSQYTKTTDKKGNKVYNYPYKVTAHEYGLNIPSNAYIQKVSVQVNMRADKGVVSEFPSCGFFIEANHHEVVKRMKNTTGWHSGSYWVKKDTKISKTAKTVTYVMDESNFHKAKFSADDLNQTYFGVDLDFSDECDNHTVYLAWVRVKVDYYLPKYSLIHSGDDTSEDNPYQTKTGRVNSVRFTLEQKTKGYGGKQCLELTMPYGTELVSVTPSNGQAYWHSNENRWIVNCNGKTKENIIVQFIDYTVDNQYITLKGVDCTSSYTPHAPKKNFYFRSGFGTVDDYGDITTQLLTPKPHKRSECCFNVSSKVITTNDDTLTYNINSSFDYEGLPTNDDMVLYELNEQLSSKGVEIVSSTDSTVTYNVPADARIDVCFRICLRPLETGSHTINISLDGGGTSNTVPLIILAPYEYHFGNKTVDTDIICNNLLIGEEIGFFNHRIASELETGAYILPCKVKDSDALMTQGKTNIHMYKWEELDYIGCVPLEHLHFDPKSTYKDKLLDTHYKNKRYMGKQLASDEDITLNVRLHPHQVTTIQGLIDMDKPIPINANHRCFEGDALNHRGWAEIYSITTTLTNPHWYKCDIDVKYLTHNLNTRFKINKGDKTFNNYTMPNLLLESVASGDELSSGNQLEDYFIVDTDGGYIYNQEEIDTEYYRDENDKIVIFVVAESDVSELEEEFGSENIYIIYGETELEFEDLLETITEEGYIILDANIGRPIVVDDTEYSNENQRNVFTLDEGQYFNIKSKEPLSNVAQISYGWFSTLIPEYKENSISKIIKLVDTVTNIPMFEYEYSDFDFSEYTDSTTRLEDGTIQTIVGEGQVSCSVILRRYVKGDYEVVLSDDIRIPVTVLGEDESSEDYTAMCGSTVSFMLNENRLTVEDTGYTGKAVNISNIELEGDNYRYEVEWRNNNTDGEDNDITTYVDLSVQDSFLASQYSNKYGNMLVSPFPVSGKRTIFTRNGEEGVIYYYDNDKEEFSYLIEPYYQYHNGVDLRTSEGTSIFNLNYGYRVVYLENGLVSLGINRLTGQMYLRKWDDDSKEYITLFYFQLENYDDVNINNISDDRIELQASNTIISMYRGHPYVILKHDTEDINIISTFGKVWGESVGDDAQAYPSIFELLNTDNMLPPCAGGTKTIDDDCIQKYECGDTVDIEKDIDLCKIYDLDDGEVFEYPSLTDVTINMNFESTIVEDEVTTIDITSTELQNGDIIYYLIDGDVLDETPVTYPNTGLSHTFDESRPYEVSAVFVGDDNRSFAVAETVTIMPLQINPSEEESDDDEQEEGGTIQCPKPANGKYVLEIIKCKSKMAYRGGEDIIFRLTRGGKPVCGETIEITDFKYTNTELTDKDGYVRIKNTHAISTPAKYKIGAKYYKNSVLVTKVYKDVEIVKSNVTWECYHYASTVGSNASFRIYNSHNSNIPLANTKVTVYIDGQAYTKKTNDKGQVAWKINKKGNKKYKCTFGGNKYYRKGEASFKEKVRKG